MNAPTPPSVSTGFQLSSQWNYLTGDSFGLSLSSDNIVTSISPDGITGWLGIFNQQDDDGGINIINLKTRTYQQLYNTTNVVDIAALSSTKAFFIAAGKQNQIFSIDSEGTTSLLSSLPNNLQAAQVVVSSNSTIWVFTTNGEILQQNYQQTSWKMIENKVAILSISAGGDNNLYGISKDTLYQYNAEEGWGKFSKQPFSGKDLSWMEACSDGSLWVQSGTTIVMYPLAGPTWVTLKNLPANSELFNPAAASMSTLVALAVIPDPLYLGFVEYKMGLTDLPSFPWPALDNEEEDAYTYISKQLGVVSGNIRGQYTDSTEPFDDWFTQLSMMKAPSGINSTAFGVVQQQLLIELKYVKVINNLFADLKSLNDELGIVNSDQLQAVAQMVGLQNNPSDNGSEIGAIFGSLFESIALILAQIYSTPVYYGMSLVFSLLDAGLTKNNGQNHQPNYNFELKYGELAQYMANLFLNSAKSTGDFQCNILSDWRKMELLGAPLVSGAMEWSDNTTSEIAEKAAPAYEVFFYQTLMPAKWKLVNVPQWLISTQPGPPPFYSGPTDYGLPSYDYIESCENEPSLSVCNIWFCQAVDACYDPFDCNKSDFTKFPAEKLLNAIYALGINKEDFMKNNSSIQLSVKVCDGNNEG